jgi:hypothetical protein
MVLGSILLGRGSVFFKKQGHPGEKGRILWFTAPGHP